MEVKAQESMSSREEKRVYKIGDYEVILFFEDNEYTGCKINREDLVFSYFKNELFVFNPNYEDHLELASKIYEVVCQLKEELNQVKSQNEVTKASGKRK